MKTVWLREKRAIMILDTEDDSDVELGDGPLIVFENHRAFVKINQGASKHQGKRGVRCGGIQPTNTSHLASKRAT